MGSLSLVAAALALGGVSFTRPLEATVDSPIAYEHAGSFEYSARVPRSAVYAGGRVRTGDTVFLRVVDRIHVRFRHQLRTDLPRALEGTAALAAELREASGWRTTITLQTPTAFAGDTAVAEGTLDLARVQALQRRFAAETGIVNPSYTLALAPVVHVNGTLAGADLTSEFAPSLAFALDELRLTPELGSPAPDPAVPTAAAADPLTPVEPRTIDVQKQAPSTIALSKLAVEVGTARRVAAFGGAAGLLGLLIGAMLLVRDRRAAEPARIQGRYGSRLIDVARSDRRSYDEVVEVTSIETLARIAESYDRMILHEASELGHSYRVADEGVLYIYLVGDPGGMRPPLPLIVTAQPPVSDPVGEPAAPRPRVRSGVAAWFGARRS